MDTAALTLLSPAKLNLFLHITGRRADGYHNLQTVFQLLDKGDVMDFQNTSGSTLQLHCTDPTLNGEDNLVLRAARALQSRTGTTQGAIISLHKHIPTGGGLGGGSSNAATTLLALNHLWQCGLNREQLAEIGLTLGADVPVFVHGRNAWAEGIGEILSPVQLPGWHYLVLTPPCHVSSAEIFSHQQLTRNTPAIKMAAFLAGHCRNDCEALVRTLYPDIDAALNWLKTFDYFGMTGTGASVFARFDSLSEAQEAWRKFSDSNDALVNPERVRAFVASGIAESALCSL
ncbi:MAG: 4-(cytidine 5'-diphospho)-2-C-methyl-D-erythritol kinase [Pseudomonadales bacterium]|nr:4-(cytidine 5'-diphospho)-2-C-methyl-D-erythritol kinase [Pseudomonadales bacterium]